MKAQLFITALALVAIVAPIAAPSAHALSCLPVDMYLEDVVGKEEIVIFVGTVTDQIEETEYTAEVITVTSVKQGYVESDVIVYHEKHPDWGYLCNVGPAKKGVTSVYIGERDAFGKYNIYQRLATNDPLVDTLDENLEDAEVSGSIGETTKTDRMNQIMTTITDMIAEIKILLKEFTYWKSK